MATRATEIRAPRPSPAKGATKRPRLRVLNARQLREHHRIRRARMMIGFSALVFAGALLFVAAGQAIVVSQQLKLDTAQQQLATATSSNTNLQIERASLDSPTRILQLAQHKLGMITPANVVYLVPVKVGPTVGSLKNIVRS